MQIGDMLSSLDLVVVLRRANRKHIGTSQSCLLLPGCGLGKDHGVWFVADTSNPEAETEVQRVFFVSDPQRYPRSVLQQLLKGNSNQSVPIDFRHLEQPLGEG